MPFIGLLAPVISSTVSTLCVSMVSQKLMLHVVKILLKKLVDSTDTEIDNQVYDQYVILLDKSIAKSA
jgi:uncharacterized membrane protein YdjX (TVP38/TMEM64 family)